MTMCRMLLLAAALLFASSRAEAFSEQEITACSDKRWQMFSNPNFDPYQADFNVATQVKKAQSLWTDKKIDEAIFTGKEALKTYPASIRAAAALAGACLRAWL